MEDGSCDYYLPATGKWTHLLTGEVREGGRWYNDRYDFLSLPLFVRAGTVLPVGAVEDRPDYDYLEGVTLRCFELAEGQEVVVSIPTLQGQVAATAKGVKRGGKITATWQCQAPQVWHLQQGTSVVRGQGASAVVG